MAQINTRIEFVGSGNLQANVDTIHLRDTYITDSLRVSEVGQAELDGRFVTNSVLGAINELMDGLSTTSGALAVDGTAELFFTQASGTEFVIQHDLDTEVWAWGMWSTDTDPIEFIQPENIYPSGANHVAVTLGQPDDGRIILSVGGPHGGDSGSGGVSGLHVDEREATGDIVPDTHATHDLGSDSKRWDNVYGISGIFGTASVLIGDDITVDGRPILPAIHTSNTFFISPTGDDATGDGSIGTPWKTLFQAFNYLNGFDIELDVTVTISVADGVYTDVPAVNISHPKALQIRIIGDITAPIGNLITSADNEGSPSRIYVAGDQTASYPAGSICHIMGSALNDSSYTITSTTFSASTIPGNTQVTLEQTLQNSQANGTLYNCPASFNCIFEMAAGASIVVEGVVISELDGICMKGNAGGGLSITHGAGIVKMGPNVSASGCDTGFSITHNSFIDGGITLVGHECGRGINATQNSSVVLTSGVAMSNNTIIGIVAADASFVKVNNAGAGDALKRAVGSKNGGDGFVAQRDGYIHAPAGMAIGNVGHGFIALVRAGMEISQSTARYNGGVGFYALVHSTLSVSSATGNNNDKGFYSDGSSSIRGDSSIARNNSSFGVQATSMGHVIFPTSTVDSNGTNFSPAINTLGNNNSHIQV